MVVASRDGLKTGYVAHYGTSCQGEVYYRDTGCSLAPACLECPYPGCMKDAVERRRVLRETRQTLILEGYREGKSDEDIATDLGISKRAIQYAMKQGVVIWKV